MPTLLDESLSRIESEVDWTREKLAEGGFDAGERQRVEALCTRVLGLAADAKSAASSGDGRALGMALRSIAETWHGAMLLEQERDPEARVVMLLMSAGTGVIQAITAAFPA